MVNIDYPSHRHAHYFLPLDKHLLYFFMHCYANKECYNILHFNGISKFCLYDKLGDGFIFLQFPEFMSFLACCIAFLQKID